jgi:O-antigen/teichoic acid export membrane protein
MSGTDADSISVRDQATLSFVGTVTDAGASFLGLVAFAYVLGPAGLGRFYLVLAAIRVAAFPVAGIGQSVMKRGSEGGGDPASDLGGGLLLGGVYVACVVLAVVAVETRYQELIPVGPAVLGAAVAGFVTKAVFDILLDGYRAYGQTGLATLWDNLLGIIETVLQLAFLLAGFGVVGLLGGSAAAAVLVAVGLIAATRLSVERPTQATLDRLVAFSRWSAIASGIGIVYSRVPVLILGALATETAVGYYSSANRLLLLGSFVGGSVAPALMVKTSATDDGASDLRTATQYVTLLSVPLAFGALAMPRALMATFFGGEFAAAGAALVALSVYHLLNPYSTIADAFVDGLDRPEYVTGAKAVALVVRGAVAVALVESFGLLGVITAVVASHAVHVVVSAAVIWRETGALVLPTRVWRQVVSGGAMYLAVRGVRTAVQPTTWLHVTALIGIGGLVYAAVLLALDGYVREMVTGVVDEGMTRLSA